MGHFIIWLLIIIMVVAFSGAWIGGLLNQFTNFIALVATPLGNIILVFKTIFEIIFSDYWVTTIFIIFVGLFVFSFIINWIKGK